MLAGLKRRIPLLGNLYVGQILFGALATLLALSLARHYSGEAPLTRAGLALRLMGGAVLLLVFGVYLQNLHRFGLVPDYSLKCRFCNGPVNRYSEFCEHCGADLIAEEKLLKCAKCGVDVYEGTKHCPECGARIATPTKGKGKGKGKKAKREAPVEEGWSTPLDAVSGFPEGPQSEARTSRGSSSAPDERPR